MARPRKGDWLRATGYGGRLAAGASSGTEEPASSPRWGAAPLLLSCSRCGASFATRAMLRAHFPGCVSRNPKGFWCAACRAFYSSTTASRHRATWRHADRWKSSLRGGYVGRHQVNI